METRGVHILADFWECPRDPLTDGRVLEGALSRAATESGAHVRTIGSYRFPVTSANVSGGVSAYAILGESHITIHTYPERLYAAIDIYTCGSHCDPRRGLQSLESELHPGRVSVTEIQRGRE